MANLRVDKITSTETFDKTGSVQFDGSGDRLVTTLSSSPSNSSFTIETWVDFTSSTSSGNNTIFDFANATGGYGLFLLLDDGVIKFRYYSDNSGTGIGSGIDKDFTSYYNTWAHLATTFDGSTYRAFLNGELIGAISSATEVVALNRLTIGARSDSSVTQPWLGHISNLRYIAGTALYTANFKPPMRELENIPGTVLLACQSKTDATLEKTGKTLTVGGNAVASELTPGILTPIPKAGAGSAITGSVEFSGGTTSNPGGYLSVPNTTDLRLGSSDFTVEAYVNFTNGAVSNGVIAALWDNTNNQRSWNFYFDRSGNDLYFAGSTNGSSGNNNVSASIDIEDNNWYHVAASRSGSTLKLFVNGVELASNTSAGTYYDNTTDLVTIGAQNHDNPTNYWKGFISNLRIVKGTALYTDDFIPPTRELKKLPGTVLLCCQDPDSPLTEATGKTITGYGDLQKADGVELVTNGDFSNGTTDWTAGTGATLTVNSGVMEVSAASVGSFGYQAISVVVGKRYKVSGDITGGTNGQISVYDAASSGTFLGGTGNVSPGSYTFWFTATVSTVYLRIVRVSSTGYYDNLSVTLDDGRGASNFTPQVGDDRKVTFEGVTKVNSDAYFYLPTGDTASREATGTYNAGTRGIFGGGFSTPTTHHDTIQYINIASLGNAVDAGNLTVSRYGNPALASDTRAVWAGGVVPTPAIYNTIDAVEIMSTGNAFDFGDLYDTVYYPGGVSNRTRGIYAGGYNPSNAPSGFASNIGYITISSKGDSQDFGDLGTAKNSYSTFGSPTRGCFAGGATPSKINTIEYVTIATTGNSADFGDLTAGRNYGGGCGSAIRGLVGGGQTPTTVNTIDYVTISAMGNAQDFGDLTSAKAEIGSCSSATRGIFAGAWSPTKVNVIDYVSLQTTGNAKDFGDLVNIGVMQECGTSNGHGGLG